MGAAGRPTLRRCIDSFLRLPSSFLGLRDAKKRLFNAIFGELVPDYVYDRPKVRAQMGNRSGGGVLGACIERGITQDRLRERFTRLHRVFDLRELNCCMRAGRYRSAVQAAKEALS